MVSGREAPYSDRVTGPVARSVSAAEPTAAPGRGLAVILRGVGESW